MRWKLRENGDFEIWSFYSVFRWPSSIVFPWKAILGVKAPRRVSFFVWTTALGKILTADNLRKSSYSIVDWCCMCWCNGEFVNHLLIHCGVAISCGALFLDLLGLPGCFLRCLMGVFGGTGIGAHLRIWSGQGEQLLAFSWGLYLIGLRLGDSHLVIPSDVYRLPYFFYIVFFVLFFSSLLFGVLFWLLHVLFTCSSPFLMTFCLYLYEKTFLCNTQLCALFFVSPCYSQYICCYYLHMNLFYCHFYFHDRVLCLRLFSVRLPAYTICYMLPLFLFLMCFFLDF